jgi:hypothetical protein
LDVEFVSILILSQDQVPREELLEALYLEFANRTNEVVVDITLAVLQ